jgi:hypothetical protein
MGVFVIIGYERWHKSCIGQETGQVRLGTIVASGNIPEYIFEVFAVSLTLGSN